MKKYCAFIFTGIILFCACSNEKKKEAGPLATEKKNYFPVADFIKSEIHYVDSLPLAIIKYNIQKDKKDSVFIKAPEFNTLAQDFLPAVLGTQAFENDYTENSFLDETTHFATFTYSAKNNNHDLKRVDVLAKPIPGTNQVTSIYMEKMITKNDTLIIKKMFWKSRKSFYVVTSTQPSGQKPVINQLKIVWDDTE